MSKSSTEIRQIFLDYFRSKGHQAVASSSLVPENDPTLLFTNAGMNQFKDLFLGLEKRDYNRAVTAQRCVRAGGKHNDLENVGYTARHHTFFEMLGNFSFGDYFKQEAIHFTWELLTGKQWFNIPVEKLWITVYESDNETYDIWANQIGIPANRIVRIGDNKGAPYASDNFWQMGESGPCGPCSEVFYDHGEQIWGGPPGSLEEDGDRYIEIWNIVFMQFNREIDGTMTPLPQPSVDTGMGLERITAVLQGVHSNYEIDLFQSLIRAAADVLHIDDLHNKSLYVLADHIRACAFLIADGVIPSNEGRGYVLRRIIRRAARHGHMLGAKAPFFYQLVAPLIKVMDGAAKVLQLQQQRVEQVLKMEEEQFARTLTRGLMLLDDEIEQLSGDYLGGEILFRLYDTYGFPFDLTADICRERGIRVDEEGFTAAMAKQQERARAASQFKQDYTNLIRGNDVSLFCGYQQSETEAKIVALFRNGMLHTGESVIELRSGEEGVIILDQTPFYAESGGQVGDGGELIAEHNQFIVQDTQKYGQAIGHIGRVSQGIMRINQIIDARIDTKYRERIKLNHSATHMLHAALREELGSHVTQKGSLVCDSCLRFDFSHHEAVTSMQLRHIEDRINQQIRRNLPIMTQIMSLEKAKASGAMALFGEKYDEQVRVLTIGDFSTELCGGTHADRTGDIGLFCIIAESGVAAGVRRIEAVTGEAAITFVHQQCDLLQNVSHLIKSDSNSLYAKIEALMGRNKVLEKENQQLKDQQVAGKSVLLANDAKEIKGIKLLVSQLPEVEPKILRAMIDSLKNQIDRGVIVLATVYDGKVSLIVGITNQLTEKIKAGELVGFIAQQIGGKGGGRPDMAQAGGTDVAGLPKALASVEAWIAAKL